MVVMIQLLMALYFAIPKMRRLVLPSILILNSIFYRLYAATKDAAAYCTGREGDTPQIVNH